MKLVVEESESEALDVHIARLPTVLVTSRIAMVEVSRAVKMVDPDEGAQVEADRLLASCALVELSPHLLRTARGLTSRAVRSLDAIHLASALRVAPDEFLCYDHRLSQAAAEHGLSQLAPGAA